MHSRFAWAGDFPWGYYREEEFEDYLADNRERWGTNEWAADQLRDWAAPSLADDPAAINAFATYVRLGASPGEVDALERMNYQIDVQVGSPDDPSAYPHHQQQGRLDHPSRRVYGRSDHGEQDGRASGQ